MSMNVWAENEVRIACKKENPDWNGTDFDVTVCHLNNVKEGRKEFCNGTDI